jgi:DNA-binding LytR/AlgR family response regulator
MQIAIVDDLQVERTLVRNLTDRYLKNRKELNITAHYEEFASGEAFLESYTPGKYQLIFMDIYMSAVTGIDVAKRIAALDKPCNIIFFTSSEDYLLDGYSVHAIGYVLKPLEKNLDAFNTAMDYAVYQLQVDKSTIMVNSDCGPLHLYHRNILYLDTIERTSYVHLTDTVIKLQGKYSDYQQQLMSDPRFLECYRNIVVNMDYIDTILDNDFVLKSGEKLPISRRKKASVLQDYMMYFIHKRGE